METKRFNAMVVQGISRTLKQGKRCGYYPKGGSYPPIAEVIPQGIQEGSA